MEIMNRILLNEKRRRGCIILWKFILGILSGHTNPVVNYRSLSGEPCRGTSVIGISGASKIAGPSMVLLGVQSGK